MIKVIEHGNVPVYGGRCGKCGCKIQCLSKDVQIERGITGNKMYVHCPECDGVIDITEAVMPASGSSQAWTNNPQVRTN